MGQNLMDIAEDDPNLGKLIGHESAHRIFDLAGLRSKASELAPKVPNLQRATVALRNDIYQPTDEVLANEGLGYSIGDPDATPYVQQAASRIGSDDLRRMLIRLHNNRVASQRLGGIGGR